MNRPRPRRMTEPQDLPPQITDKDDVPPRMKPKAYLGDSVYVECVADDLILTTNNGEADSNTIVLEPEVYEALLRYTEDR